ncbi:GNAT family N-acetyltransferase [Confluentibacter sediminis]|uniref:GNAT family N-acetyltransferase n=1 Tax=Confluentibacter sediminis TaxID=2219045 RepID=UPI000DAD7263|nr:GNAT family N-acetyltransferase [Confluentibacter sediminis]
MNIQTFDASSKLSIMDIKRVTNFLYEHSGTPRDSKSAIKKSLLYAIKEISGLGGFVFVLEYQNEISGVLVINKTGMNEYIPENILVYLVINEKYSEDGIKERLINYAINYCKGDIALYINKESPELPWFEKKGFKTRNIEMRLTR